MVRENALHEIAAANPKSNTTATAVRIRTIGLDALWHSLKLGVDDFRANPSHLVFFCVFYPVFTLLMTRIVIGADMLPLAFPLISGFTLIGPVVAVGLFEMSRRREMGQDVTLKSAAGVIHSPAFPAIVTLAIGMMALYAAWIYMADMIYTGLFGKFVPSSIPEFLSQVFTTEQGWALIFYGTATGFVFAVAALAISVIAFPLLLDRHVSLAMAVKTSIEAVAANPMTMAVWGLTVVGLLIAGALPVLLGLVVVLPVLGHATWHLYRAVVEPE